VNGLAGVFLPPPEFSCKIMQLTSFMTVETYVKRLKIAVPELENLLVKK